MKITILIICLLNFTQLAKSQKSEKQEFIGVIQTSNNEIITYKISFNDIGNGEIKGESVTDFYGKNSTKSIISGTISETESQISFKELNNISSKSSAVHNEFCFIEVKNIKIKEIKNKKIIQGKFKGLFPTGKVCAEGTIYLVSTEILKELNIDNDSLIKIDSLLKISQLANELKLLKKNDKLKLKWNDNKILLEVWDSYTEDNDVITIYFNDKVFIENLEIKNKKKLIEIPFKEKIGTIKIVAVNEGNSGSNTVNIILKNGKKTIPVMSSLKKNEEIYFELEK